MMIDEYCLIKCIGRGAFGEVYLTNKKGSNQLYATKKVSKQKIESPSIKKYFINEINILKELNHKNIIRLETIRQTAHNFYIITEFYNGGGLSECLRKHRMIKGRPFSEEIVQHLMRQIIDALKYLHSKRIIHRDLKLDNILINFESEEDKKNLNLFKSEAKIIDFGFATYLDSNGLRFSILGSPINMDPALLSKLINQNLSNLIGYNEKADIWSLGTVCYELITGKPIFHAQNLLDLVRLVENGIYHLPTDISEELVSFLTSMVQYSSKNRLSAEELSKHPFLTKNINEFTKLNLADYANKMDAKGIIFNIKKDPQLDKPIFDVQARLNYFQQQQIYQNFKNNGIQRFTPAYNYYGNTGPKYYMAKTTTRPVENKVQLNQQGQMKELLNPLINKHNTQLQRQPYSYQDKNLKNNNLYIEQNYKKATNIMNQNYNTHYKTEKNFEVNNSDNINKKYLLNGVSSNHLPTTNNIGMMENKYKLHQIKSFEEKKNIQKYSSHTNKHYSNKMNNHFIKNPSGIPPITEVIKPSPIPFSSPFDINNPIHTGPLPMDDDDNSDINSFYKNFQKNSERNNNKSLPSYIENNFINNNSKKEISSDALDDLFDFHIGKELEPEPEVFIDK